MFVVVAFVACDTTAISALPVVLASILVLVLAADADIAIYFGNRCCLSSVLLHCLVRHWVTPSCTHTTVGQ